MQVLKLVVGLGFLVKGLALLVAPEQFAAWVLRTDRALPEPASGALQCTSGTLITEARKLPGGLRTAGALAALAGVLVLRSK